MDESEWDRSELDGPSALEAEAAEWLIRLRDAGLGEAAALRAAFDRWCDSDPAHAQAYARISRTWDALDAHAQAPEISALRREAREVLGRLHLRASRRRAFRWAAIVAPEVAAAAAVAAYVFLWPKAELITTGVGERRVVELADRSSVELDADSSISVAFDRDRRLVHVLRGEAYFQVAKHQPRPFVVESHGRAVVATGTAFDVEALSGGLHVTLVEGRVDVRTSQRMNAPLLAKLVPGDTFIVQAGSADRLEHGANLLSLLAWRTGHLMFDNVPLANAVGRMGRYVHQRIAVDPSVASLRISGVFAAGDMHGLIEAVEAYYPVAEALEPDGGIRLTHRS